MIDICAMVDTVPEPCTCTFKSFQLVVVEVVSAVLKISWVRGSRLKGCEVLDV